MKNTSLLILLFVLSGVCAYAQQGGGSEIAPPDSSLIPEKKFSLTVDCAATNSYLWRGIEFNHGLIIQPSLNIERAGWNFNVWNSTSMIETRENSFTPELDFTLSKAIEVGNFYIEPSAMLYGYPTDFSSSTIEAGIYAAYFIGSFGIFINPSTDVLQNSGGMFSETGFTFDNETDSRHIIINAAYGVSNKKFIAYNITDEEIFSSPYQLIDLNASWQQNLKNNFYIRPFANCFLIMGSDYSNIVNTRPLSIMLSVGKDF